MLPNFFRRLDSIRYGPYYMAAIVWAILRFSHKNLPQKVEINIERSFRRHGSLILFSFGSTKSKEYIFRNIINLIHFIKL